MRDQSGRDDILFIISRLVILFNKHNLSGKVLTATTPSAINGRLEELSLLVHTPQQHITQRCTHRHTNQTHITHTLHSVYTTKSHSESSAGLQTPLIIPLLYPPPSVQTVVAVLASCAILRASIFTVL